MPPFNRDLIDASALPGRIAKCIQWGLLSVLVASVVACGSSDSSQPVTPVNTNAGSKILETEFKKYFADCDGVWAAVRKTRVKARSGPWAHISPAYHQYANLEFRVEPQKLTGTDALNGITFIGHVNFGEQASYRKYSYPDGKPGEWDSVDFLSWEGEVRNILQEKDGVWNFSDTRLNFDGLEKMDCAALPKS